MSGTYAAAVRDRVTRIIGNGVLIGVEKLVDVFGDMAADTEASVRVNMAFVYAGRPPANDRWPPVQVRFAGTIAASDGGSGAARTAATGTAIWTLYRAATPSEAGTAIATLTFTAGNSAPALATTGSADQAVAATDYVWGEWGAQDATLADVTCTVTLNRTI